MTTHRAPTRAARGLLPGLVAAVALGGSLVATPSHASDEDVPSLQLVTLTGAGTSGSSDDAATLLARQDAVLAAIDAPETTYRWTTALNGFAVELTEDQVSALETNSEVETIEANSVLPMAGRVTSKGARASHVARPRGRAGSGVVIGFVDSGLAPDSPLFADVPGLGARTSTGSVRKTPSRCWRARPR